MRASQSALTIGPPADGLSLPALEAFLLGIASCCYLLAYPPFIFTWYVPEWLRLSLELLIVLPMIAQQIIARKKSVVVLLFAAFGVAKLATSFGDIQTVLSRFDKVVFAACLFDAARLNPALKRFLHGALELVFIVTGVQLILSSFLWFTMPGLYVEDALRVTEHSAYGYAGNLILGNVAPRSFGPLAVARPMGYFMEPGLVGCLLVLYAFSPEPQRLGRSASRLRTVFFIAAAVSTVSISVLGLLGARLCYRVFKRKWMAIAAILLAVSVVLVAYQALTSFMPSAITRMGRSQGVLSLFLSSSPVDLAIGHEVGAGETEEGAINSGIQRILVEHGLILGAYFLLFMKRRTICVEDFTTMILMNLAFDFLWWPVFWVIAVVLRERE
jgi:hypothetical protein